MKMKTNIYALSYPVSGGELANNNVQAIDKGSIFKTEANVSSTPEASIVSVHKIEGDAIEETGEQLDSVAPAIKRETPSSSPSPLCDIPEFIPATTSLRF
ncbi:hypothetical protein ACMFMG_007168 [Clarireedia jacksonii]